MTITWDFWLVAWSVTIAVLGSYTALTHAQRMRENSGRTATIWMLAGGSTLGVAIWSMHFIGMLAFHLPTPIGFDLGITALSLFFAMLAALLGFHILRKPCVSSRRILVSGVWMGGGISAMHYLGMAAIKMSPAIAYPPTIVLLSVLIAIAASWVALWILYHPNWSRLPALPRTLLGAVVMGLAISAMHYTAMLGMRIRADALCLTDALAIAPGVMAAMLSLTVLVWFGGGLLASLFDQRMARKNAQALADLEQEHAALRNRSAAVSNTMIAALRESEEKLRMTMQNAPDAVFITEQDGRIVYVNDNVLALLGYDREQLYAMTVYDLVPQDWLVRYRAGAQRILASHTNRLLEIRLLSRSGEKIPIELNTVLLPNGHVYGSCRDIRERKQSEAALKESVLFNTLLLQTMPVPVFYKDTAGRYTGCNVAFAEFVGKSNADILGKNVFEIAPRSQPEVCHEHDLALLASEDGVQIYESTVQHADGTLHEVIFHKARLHDTLGAAIGIIGVVLDITDRKQSERDIHQLAFYDALTNLPNRRLLIERARQALALSARTGRYGALILLDLDNFKKLNDTRGHDAGDRLLCEVAQRLQDCVREGDTVARLGGDEFVVVLEGLDSIDQEAAAQAESVAEKIRASLGEPYRLQDYTHQTSASIGVVMFRGHLENIDALFKYADIAMYQAKQSGRDAICFYDPDMQAAINARIEMEAALEQALHGNQLCLYYQVQMDAQQRALGAEVLMRWMHPQRGMVSPAEFIPLAEETGQIVAMGLWALRTACVQLKIWQADRHTCDLTLAVNVSARQFRNVDFVQQVERVLVETGAKPSHLKLELTESTVLENVEDTIAKMRKLKLLGISFSMDDFGTGYSSLQYLKRLPLDQIKIDQSFVHDITTDPNDAAIVQTIIAMSEALGLNVIAEGVETREQQAFLELRGCQNFQGYLFGRPLPLTEFETALKEGAAAA